jgi:hypothetical protein
MDGDIERRRSSWADRFSSTMHALDPGMLILLQWLTRIVVLIAILRAPEALSWLG